MIPASCGGWSDPIAVVVLAAGAGSRVGGPKALLEIAGTTFLARVLATARAAGVARRIVVLAPDVAVAVEADVIVLRNSKPSHGPLSSLRLGLAAAADLDGVLAWPVDHPLVRADTVVRILDEARRRPAAVVIPTFAGRGGHPTFFARALYDEIAALPDGEGARGLFARRPDAVARIDVDDAAVVEDVDTQEDLARARATLRAGRA